MGGQALFCLATELEQSRAHRAIDQPIVHAATIEARPFQRGSQDDFVEIVTAERADPFGTQ